MHIQNWFYQLASTVGRGLFFALVGIICIACAASTPTASPLEVKGGGGEFRIGINAEPQSLNPDVRSDDPAFFVGQNLFNKLITLDVDYRIIPDLAETWQISDDGLTYTFRLAKNARWHDGQPCTSADAKWTFEQIVQGGGPAKDFLMRVANIETPDAATLTFRLKESWSPFLPSLAWYGTFILPKHIYASGDWLKQPANDKPVGTGAFKFGEWVKGERITLEANREFFGRGPYPDRIVFHILKDTSAGFDLLLKGELDFVLTRPPAERIPVLQRAPEITFQTFPHPARYYIGFNLRRKPFDDVRVRQAFNHAINRPLLVDVALLGYGAPASGFYTPAIPWAYNPNSRAPAFDLNAAENLLEQAGLTKAGDGARLKATLVSFNVSPFQDIANVLRDQVRAAGIELNVIALNQADYTKRVNEARDFDLAISNGSWGPDPDNLDLRFGAKGRLQFMSYASAEFDAAIADAARSPKLEERAKAYFRAQDILARDLPLAPLVENVQFVVARANVTGLPQLQARGLVTFNDYRLVRVKK